MTFDKGSAKEIREMTVRLAKLCGKTRKGTKIRKYFEEAGGSLQKLYLFVNTIEETEHYMVEFRNKMRKEKKCSFKRK